MRFYYFCAKIATKTGKKIVMANITELKIFILIKFFKH